MNATVPSQQELYYGGWLYFEASVDTVYRVHPAVSQGYSIDANGNTCYYALPKGSDLIANGFVAAVYNVDSVALPALFGDASPAGDFDIPANRIARLYCVDKDANSGLGLWHVTIHAPA